MLGNLIDKVISPFAPLWAARRQVARHALAQLATYSAADVGRRNSDWRSNAGSADLAIIPDARIMLARARQLVRDSWIAASAVKAASRNVIGRGIVPVPSAHDKDGKPLTKVNARLAKLFKEWAEKAVNCDIEARQNFYQKQSQLVEERFTAGESFLVWSYAPPVDAYGSIDRRKPVGLRFQSFEPEQLDLTKQSYGANEVRGGVEIDEEGRPAAYHFWTRNPSDYLFRRQMHSVRIPASRVMHYYKQDRVLQTRGVSSLAPVMQNIRDFHRYEQAGLWAAIMQACVGMVITKNTASGPMGTAGAFGMGLGANDTGQTPGGMRKIDFVPGMAPELMPGEDVKFMAPQSPGGQYEPFTATSLRGIGAGMGISYGLLARHFDGNYSAARQDMLEDDKQWGPEQDLIAGTTLDPLYVLFVQFAAAEGRLDDLPDEFNLGEFLFDETRFTSVEHITPARPWIDPEKEMNAFEMALANNLKTREQIITEIGGRYRDTFLRKAEEQKFARSLGLENPEDKGPQFRRDLISSMAASPSVTDAIDVAASLASEGIATRKDYQQPIAAPPAATAPPAAPPAQMNAGDQLPPPNYRLSVLPAMRCATCSQFDSGPGSVVFCRRFGINVNPEFVCDRWDAVEVTATTNVSRGRTLPPYPAPGEPPIDRNFEAAGRTQFDL